MAKSKKKRPQRRRTDGPPRSPEADLLDALRAALDHPTPGPLLGNAALLLSTTTRQDAPPLDVLVQSLSDLDRPETDAALVAVATLAGNAELRRRLLRGIADRGQVLPRWLAQLHRTEPLDRAVEISTVYRDADHLLVSATAPGGSPLTAVVLVDNELGAFAADANVVEAPLEDVIAMLVEDAGPDVRVRDLPPADARARIEGALRALDMGHGTGGYEDWTERRPLVEWLASLLPAGGEVSGLGELSDDELDAVAERFLASPFGPAWSRAQFRPLLDDVLASGSGNGAGDPLVWSPRNVDRLLDPQLFFLDSTTPFLERAPELLRDLVRYGHAERGLRPELTGAALRAIDAATDAFLAGVRESDDDESDLPEATSHPSP